MKAEIEKTGFIRITAETVEEAFALKYVMDAYKDGFPYIVDCSILMEDDNRNQNVDGQ